MFLRDWVNKWNIIFNFFPPYFGYSLSSLIENKGIKVALDT